MAFSPECLLFLEHSFRTYDLLQVEIEENKYGQTKPTHPAFNIA